MKRQRGLGSYRCRILAWLLAAVSLANASSARSSSTSSTSSTSHTAPSSYATARHVRTVEGHAAALELYQDLLHQHPHDITAATRLAAATATPLRHDAACPPTNLNSHTRHDPTAEKIQRLGQWLTESDYTLPRLQALFDIHDHDALYHATTPIYIKGIAAGAVAHYPWNPFTDNPTPVECLAALFLLGLCVPLETLLQVWEPADLQRLQDLGLAFPCEHDSNLIVPYVQIAPLQLDAATRRTLYLVTDWHPAVLSSTVAGSHDAVMYIGPDSLALVQHWIHAFPSILIQAATCSTDCNSVDNGNRSPPATVVVVDVCTGSGIQALAALAMLGPTGNARAVCVDVNPRALRFTAFNAALNGLSAGAANLQLVLGNVLTGEGQLWTASEQESGVPTTVSETIVRAQDKPLLQVLREAIAAPTTADTAGSLSVSGETPATMLLTANPPFLPVPPDIVQARHGLFSAGGPSGEAVLAGIVQTASQLLTPGSYLAIVSEFFLQKEKNQDEAGESVQTESTTADALMERIQTWWGRPSGRGLLLTNQFPVSAATYAERRADSPEERNVWLQHLQDLSIDSASPGLLYIQKLTAPEAETFEQSKEDKEDEEIPDKDPQDSLLQLHHVTVEKSKWGSLWTPSNPVGVEFTQSLCQQFFGSAPDE